MSQGQSQNDANDLDGYDDYEPHMTVLLLGNTRLHQKTGLCTNSPDPISS